MTNFVQKTYWKLGKWECGRRWLNYNTVQHAYGFLKKVFIINEVLI